MRIEGSGEISDSRAFHLGRALGSGFTVSLTLPCAVFYAVLLHESMVGSLSEGGQANSDLKAPKCKEPATRPSKTPWVFESRS